MKLRLAVVLAAFCVAASAATLNEGLDLLRKGDYAAAARVLRPLADAGDAEAQYRMGLIYENGAGVPVDKAQAVSWLRKSAAQRHPSAQLELGVVYATGDGVAQDDKQAVDWFRKAAEQNNPTAQYNLGLMYAKGTGVARDDAQAVAWFRKAADQGLAIAQFKLGVAYENGEGVGKDEVLAYANYAIAARSGSKDAPSHRDAVAARLSKAPLAEGQSLAANWEPGKPMPSRDKAGAAASAASSPDSCTAEGSLEGARFKATHCAVALYGDQHSVAIWFSEAPIAADEAAAFALSAYADASKGGKQRTMAIVMFCPGGGKAQASPGAVKAVDLNTNHASSPLAGLQRVLKAPAELKVERMTGQLAPGGRLSGKLVGNVAKTSLTLDFDVTLPAKDAAAGMTCS